MTAVSDEALTRAAWRLFILTVVVAAFGMIVACSSSSSGGDAAAGAGGGGAGGASGMGGEGGAGSADGSAILSCTWALTPCARCDGRSCCGDFCCAAGEWCDTSGATPRCRCGHGESCTVPPVVGPCSPMRSNPDPCVRYCCAGDC